MCGEKTAKDGSNGKDSKCQTKGNNMTTRIVVFKWQPDEVIRLEVCNYSKVVNGTTYRKYDNRPNPQVNQLSNMSITGTSPSSIFVWAMRQFPSRSVPLNKTRSITPLEHGRKCLFCFVRNF